MYKGSLFFTSSRAFVFSYLFLHRAWLELVLFFLTLNIYMKIYIKMFSKYFLLLAGLFTRSWPLFPPHPSESKSVLSSPPPIARQLTWLSSQQESPAALCRASVCRWDLALRVPGSFLVFNCMCTSLTFGKNLRILPLPLSYFTVLEELPHHSPVF